MESHLRGWLMAMEPHPDAHDRSEAVELLAGLIAAGAGVGLTLLMIWTGWG